MSVRAGLAFRWAKCLTPKGLAYVILHGEDLEQVEAARARLKELKLLMTKEKTDGEASR